MKYHHAVVKSNMANNKDVVILHFEDEHPLEQLDRCAPCECTLTELEWWEMKEEIDNLLGIHPD